MGTRNLTIVVHNGVYKIAQYGQWDGYPDGQGLTVLNFCKEFLNSPENIETFVNQIHTKTYEPSQEEINNMWKEFDVDLEKCKGFVEFKVAKKFDEKYPSLSRDTAAEILKMVFISEKQLPVVNNIDFALDSLFCEWAYVIDLDNMYLEVYKGFNKNDLDQSDRFFKMEIENKETLSAEKLRKNEYNAIKIVTKFSLYDLPKKEEFFNIINELTKEPDEQDN
jgi:hypothetical protein